mmetsp:Transcript_15576/g.26065  ORF Transcript_15576/g.26065 Transcript_15576/m.26065 type:complete len:224 (+) Transcript_15576:1003-1674(+)
MGKIPLPGLGINWLAHGAKDFQRAQIVVRDGCCIESHEGANRGGGGVELRDLVALYEVPVAAGIRVRRHTLEHDRGASIGQRPIDNIGMAGNPATVRDTCEDVLLLQIKRALRCHHCVQNVTRGRMGHPLGLACGTRRVQNEKVVFAVHRLTGAVRSSFRHPLVHPHVFARMLNRLIARVLEYKQTSHFTTLLDCIISDFLQAKGATTALSLVRSHHKSTVTI